VNGSRNFENIKKILRFIFYNAICYMYFLNLKIPIANYAYFIGSIHNCYNRVSTTPGNPGNLLEFKNPPGNLLEFNGHPGNFV